MKIKFGIWAVFLLFACRFIFAGGSDPNNVPSPVFYSIQVDSSIVDSIKIDSLVKPIAFDTITNELLNMPLTLVSQLDVTGLSRHCIEIPIQQKDSNYQWVFWLGIGAESETAYQALETKPPAAWEKAGVSHPLIAYNFGLIDTLPMSRNMDSLAFYLLGEEDRMFFLQRRKRLVYQYRDLAKGDFYDKEQGKKDSTKLYACFENDNSVSPVNVTFRVVDFLIQEQADEQ